MQYLRADTITEVTVGPAVAVGDGFTPVTGLVGTSADEFELIKHGATTTTTIAGTLAAITGADGYYALDLSATDTNTEGRLTLLINDDSLILPIRLEFMVVSQPVFDSLFAVAGTDTLPVDVEQWDGTAVATPTQAGVPEVDLTFVSGVAEDLPSNTDLNARTLAAAAYFDPAADTVVNVTNVATLTGHTVQTADHTAGIADIPTVAEFNARTIVTAAYFDPAVDTVANVTTVAALATDSVSAAAMSAGAAQKIRDEILPTQNAAFNNMEFLFVDSTDHVTPVTAAGTLAVTRSIDGGAFGAGTGTGPVEVGNGIYQYDASAADMNGGVITFRFTAASGTPNAPDDVFVTIVTGGGV